MIQHGTSISGSRVFSENPSLVGCSVTLQGLVSDTAKHLNGQMGQALYYEPTTRRFAVRLNERIKVSAAGKLIVTSRGVEPPRLHCAHQLPQHLLLCAVTTCRCHAC